MTAERFRGTAAWKRARKLALKGATHCALCNQELRFDVGPRHPLAPSVDHVTPLATLDLSTAAGRAVAVDQALLRVAHLGCNARRGAGSAARNWAAGTSTRRPRPRWQSRDWGLGTPSRDWGASSKAPSSPNSEAW